MILVALGSNLSGPWGSPLQTIHKALRELDRIPLHLERASEPIVTKPFGVLDQPDFVNAVAIVQTAFSAEALLQKLHEIERAAGRKRGKRWGPRCLDLDLIAYNDKILGDASQQKDAIVLPHPGIAEREFVLQPIAEIAPNWRHPTLHLTAAELLHRLTTLS